VLARRRVRSTTKIIEHLVDVYKKTIVGERLELENLELFDSVAQNKIDFLPAIIHQQHEQKIAVKILDRQTSDRLLALEHELNSAHGNTGTNNEQHLVDQNMKRGIKKKDSSGASLSKRNQLDLA
jgi:hypothetical protein